jgi:hypothetical protein
LITSDFDSEDGGSIPSGGTKKLYKTFGNIKKGL